MTVEHLQKLIVRAKIFFLASNASFKVVFNNPIFHGNVTKLFLKDIFLKSFPLRGSGSVGTDKAQDVPMQASDRRSVSRKG